MNHQEDYPAEYLASILSDVKTIAMVGASPAAPTMAAITLWASG